MLRTAATLIVTGALVAAACNGGGSRPTLRLTPDQLQDPEACRSCHPDQFEQWSGSMHAYAAEDPVFLAMNKRGQRETNGALGDFCVKCHAPVAVAQKLTTDGLNLAGLPAPAKGVTCYFCHAAESVAGSHDNPLVLAADETLFGPFADPVPGSPHDVRHSNLLDELMPQSAAACGSCHDIVNQHGTAIERTFQEWKETLFAVPPYGQTCAACHMAGKDAPAATTTTRVRRVHDHSLAGVDLALTPFPNADAQRQAVQRLLDPTLLTTVCYRPTTGTIEVDLDNAGAGHAFPSGATQDRRAWVEVVATAGDEVIYQSGIPPTGQTVEEAPDADLWMIRDCIFGPDGAPVHMFWEAAAYATNLLPGSVLPVTTDPASFTKTHIKKIYPGGGAKLTATPDRITVNVRLKAVADEVIADLVASGDLDPSHLSKIPVLTPASGTVEWTMARAAPIPGLDGVFCVVPPGAGYRESPNVAKSNAHCAR